MQNAVPHEEDIRAGRLGHLAAIVQHQRVLITGLLGGMFGEGADHVEARRLGMARRGVGGRPAPLGMGQANALHLVGKIVAPMPDGDGQVDRVVLGRNAHHLRSAPGYRAHIGALEAGLFQRLFLGPLDFLNTEGNVEAHDAGRIVQAFGMVQRAEDLAAIGALALKNGRGVVQRVRQNVHFRVPPGYERAIHPDVSVAVIIRDGRHCVRSSLALLLRFAFISDLWPNPST